MLFMDTLVEKPHYVLLTLSSSPPLRFSSFLKTGPHVAQADLKLLLFLLPPPKCSDVRCGLGDGIPGMKPRMKLPALSYQFVNSLHYLILLARNHVTQRRNHGTAFHSGGCNRYSSYNSD